MNRAAVKPPNARRSDTFSRRRREELALGVSQPKDKRQGGKRARITVTVRKKPLLPNEALRGETDVLRVDSRTKICIEEPRKDVTGAPMTTVHDFKFDRIYDETCPNKKVYDSCVRTLVDTAFQDGKRCSCFAFGQTGSGKTYTMVGPNKLGQERKGGQMDDIGLWGWATRDMVAWIRKPEFAGYGLFISFFEIYINKVYDLLNDRKLVKALETKTSEGVVVKDLQIVQACTEEEVLSLIGKGLAARTTGRNSRNNESSRGHAILTIDIKNLEQGSIHGKMAFIDLAGSERGADTIASGRATQQDGAGINRSLLALKECIRAMDQGHSHIPFRDSELTKVLRDMFITDSCLTLMIATVSSSTACCEQTLNTLRYAQRVFELRQKSRPCINEPSSNDEEGTATKSPNAATRIRFGINDVRQTLASESESIEMNCSDTNLLGSSSLESKTSDDEDEELGHALLNTRNFVTTAKAPMEKNASFRQRTKSTTTTTTYHQQQQQLTERSSFSKANRNLPQLNLMTSVCSPGHSRYGEFSRSAADPLDRQQPLSSDDASADEQIASAAPSMDSASVVAATKHRPMSNPVSRRIPGSTAWSRQTATPTSPRPKTGNAMRESHNLNSTPEQFAPAFSFGAASSSRRDSLHARPDHSENCPPLDADVLCLVKQVVPDAADRSECALLSGAQLENEDEGALKNKEQSYNEEAWRNYTRFVVDQTHALNHQASLLLELVKLSQSLDNSESLNSNGRPSVSTGAPLVAKTVGIDRQKIKRVRTLIEQALGNFIKLGRSLTLVEASLENCCILDKEAQKRSMKSLHFYPTNTASRATRSPKVKQKNPSASPPSKKMLESV